MVISLIVAMDRARGIGKDNRVPWHLSADLKRFKAVTMDHHLIVGRKTWESIGRALAGRTMVIVTRSPEYAPENCPDCRVVASLREALALAEEAGETEAFIGGGGQIFRQALPLAGRIYLTEVNTIAGCDVFFPPVDLDGWIVLDQFSKEADARNDFSFLYRVWQKPGAPTPPAVFDQ